jgi:hypothetical protein
MATIRKCWWKLMDMNWLWWQMLFPLHTFSYSCDCWCLPLLVGSLLVCAFIKYWFSTSRLEKRKKYILSKQNQTLLFSEDPCPVFLHARDRWRACASGTDAVRELCSECTAIWFFGSVHATAYFYNDDVSRLSATTTLLRRRHDRSVEFIHRRCWVSVSISSVFFLLLVLQYACLDVLQSSFKYACLECVTFKLSICVYVLIMSNNFWIKIMRKLSRFLTNCSRTADYMIKKIKIRASDWNEIIKEKK